MQLNVVGNPQVSSGSIGSGMRKIKGPHDQVPVLTKTTMRHMMLTAPDGDILQLLGDLFLQATG
jgi:hypothetical protein